SNGYAVQPAFSGTEAMMYIEKDHWDMVLLDLMLPGLNGEEVLSKIREDNPIPVIIISAKGDQQEKVRSLRAGADDFITKPFDIEEVSARVDAHLRRYHMINKHTSTTYTHKDIHLD